MDVVKKLNLNCVDEIKSIRDQIVEKFSPTKIILFGSQINGTATNRSDIDLCVIKNVKDKRKFLTEVYFEVESKKPFDLILYTESEWSTYTSDISTFAYQINKKGEVIYG